jgi:type II secretory pathway pseudopilin PulG
MKIRIIKKENKRDKQAFTLVEIIVILFIVSVGMIGVLSLVVQNIQSQVINKNNIIANQLAQEGVELIRKTRDTNWVNGSSWDQWILAGTYTMDFEDSTPQLLLNASQAVLAQDANGFYVHDSGLTSTNFSRQIEISDISAEQKNIKVSVTWQERNQAYTHTLEAMLYNWFAL